MKKLLCGDMLWWLFWCDIGFILLFRLVLEKIYVCDLFYVLGEVAIQCSFGYLTGYVFYVILERRDKRALERNLRVFVYPLLEADINNFLSIVTSKEQIDEHIKHESSTNTDSMLVYKISETLDRIINNIQIPDDFAKDIIKIRQGMDNAILTSSNQPLYDSYDGLVKIQKQIEESKKGAVTQLIN